MKTVRIPSPARSQGAGPRTPIRHKHRRTLSVGTARSNASGRLTAIIQQNRNMDSFTVSPLASRRSILSDNTEIEEPRRKSWWKKLGENSRDVTELFEDNKIEEPNNIIEELDIEILSQENKNYTMDLPESSDTESINSIVIPQRKLFTQKENLQQKKFGEIIGTRETLAKLHKTNTNAEDKTINIPTRELFQNKQRSKPIFPTALLNISPNKTAADKTKEITTVEPKAQVRNIFGNRAAKRKNIFTNFIVSESEDEIPDIQPKGFGFQKMLKSRRLSSTSSRAMREPSPASSIATDIEMDDWNMLPSSTMVEHQLEVMMTGKSNKTLPSKVTEESAQLESTQEKSNRSTKARNKSQAKDTSEVVECIIKINHEQADHPNNVSINLTSRNKENLNEENINHSPKARNKSHAKDTSKEEEDKRAINHEQTDHALENKIEVKKKKQQQENIENQCQEIQDDCHENINQIDSSNDKDEFEVNINRNQQVDDNEEKEIDNDINHQVYDNEENEVEINADTNEQIDDKEKNEAKINDDINKLVDDDEDKEVEINDNINQQTDETLENEVEVDDDMDQHITDNEENDAEIDDYINQEITEENEIEINEDLDQHDDNDEIEVDKNYKNELQNTQNVEMAQKQQDEIEDQNFNFDLQSESEELNEEIENASENDEELHESLDGQDQSRSKNASHELDDEVDNNEHQEMEDESDEEQHQSEVELNESHEIESENESEEQNMSQEVEKETEEQNESHEEEETEEQNESHVEDQDESEAIADSENDELHSSQDNVSNVSDNNDIDQIESENQDNEEIETPNVSHDTTGRNRKKNESPEVILHDSNKHLDSFAVEGRNTSVRKTEMIKSMNIRPSLAPVRESTGFSDGATNSSAEGSGWDSHRTTRKTLRQTFGRDFTPRKSLRALVMEKSAKRQTKNEIASVTEKFPQANSTELPEMSNRYDDDNPEGGENHLNHEVSLRTRQTTLEMYMQNIKKKNTETRLKMEEAARNSLNAASKDHIFKVPAKPFFARQPKTTTKAKQTKSTLFLGELPAEVIEDMKYKPPKRFQPSNAPWITKRLYKYLETKLESKYDYKARIRAEKLVENIYHFAKELRRHDVASTDAVDVLKREMARLDVVKTHFDFYEFFHQFMPREVRVKVVPDVVNKITLPKRGVFSDII